LARLRYEKRFEMAWLSTTTKGKVGVKAARGLAMRPELAKLAFRASKPLLKRRARQSAEQFTDTARTVATILAIYGPLVGQELGLVEAPKSKRTAPRVAVGIVIGASAVYFLEPRYGRERREQLLRLVS
jgi:hypothetical protein